ncbi:MAG: hypothetical protein EON88_31325 [Brevundimonas sp.]|nr:MAG: hypothetical protein EON88_31325 [Brevundimonas sp.]
MGFPEARERLQASVFARLGEDALWNGSQTPVRVRLGEEDGDAGFGAERLISRVQVIRVHQATVGQPAEEDVVQLVKSGRRFRLRAEASLDANGVWMGKATKGGKEAAVSVDYKGAVTAS